MQNKKIATSILEFSDNKNLHDKINELIDAGTDWIHYDIMDGLFVKNKTPFNETIIKSISKTKAHFKDFHLMVNDPEKYIDKYAKVATSITFHHESLSYSEAKRIFEEYGNGDLKLGIAINPSTNIEQVYEYLHLVDMVLVMSVIPGKGGQKFIKNSLIKIQRLKKYIEMNELKTLIQVDGGVNNENINSTFHAGVNIVVSGSYITKGNFKQQIKNLKLLS